MMSRSEAWPAAWTAGAFGAGLAAGYLYAKSEALELTLDTPNPSAAGIQDDENKVEATTHWMKDEPGDVRTRGWHGMVYMLNVTGVYREVRERRQHDL